jgi:hypothetical protein
MARQDDLRIGDAERDAVTAALHDHYAAGRLDREELDERLDATLTSKTHADLKAIVQDLPGTNGLPEPAQRGHHHAHWVQHHGPWGHGPAQWTPGPPYRRHRHGPSPLVPLVIVPLIVLTFVTGPRPLLLMILQVALLVWIIKAVTRTRSGNRPR